MSNLSILDRNIIAGLRGTYAHAEAEALYLRLRDHYGSYDAERLALTWVRVASFVWPLLVSAAQGHGVAGDRSVARAVFAFIRERFYRQHVPGN